MDDDLKAVVLAFEQLRAHRLERRQAELDDLTARDQALVRYRTNSRRPVAQIARDAEDALREAGWTDDDLRGAGVSFYSVRAALERPRHPS